MTERQAADSGEPSPFSRHIERLFQERFADPAAPRAEEVRRLAEEMLLRQTELESSVDNLRTIARQLEKYRDRYVDLYELAPVGYATLDEEGYVQEINLAGAELLGSHRDELIGYPLEGRVAPRDREEFLRQVRRCCCEQRAVSFDVGLLASEGKAITAHLRGVPIRSLDADASFCKITIADITERKMAEEAMRASEANYRAVFDTANDAIFVHDIETGAILDANPKATEMYGYTNDELRRMNVGDVSEGHPPYTQDDAAEWIRQALAGVPQRFDWKARDKAGGVFWTGVSLKRTTFNGAPRLLAIVRDITERKKAEEALRESEERFRTVAEYTCDWEYWRGPDGGFRYVSPSCRQVTGYSAEEFVADPALLERIIHPDDRDPLIGHFRTKVPLAGHHTLQYRIVSHAGEERWIEHMCQAVYDAEHRWLGHRASNRDITDRKRVERELRERIEALEKRLADAGPV